MEAFSMLKYWRGGGGGRGGVGAVEGASAATPTATMAEAMHTETEGENEDEGPFFDLEFSVPDEEEEGGEEGEGEEEDVGSDSESEEEETDGEREFGFAVSSAAADGRADPNLSLSPSDDLFFKGKLIPLESSGSLLFNPEEPNSKPPFPASFLKSATKFRVFFTGFKKPKAATDSEGSSQKQSKSFTVKFKVDEVPIISLFTRDNSSRNSSGGPRPPQKLDEAVVSEDGGPSSSEMKRFTKDVLQKYLKMIKPLYVKVSKRYGEKLRFSGQLSIPSVKAASPEGGATGESQAAADSTAVKIQKPGNLPPGLRVVCKHLGKSRSASAAVAAVPPAGLQSQRRDDSLLQQQDGIQSAILHCKRSFNASRGLEQHRLPSHGR